MHPLAGVYSAAVTPLKMDFSPDLEAIPVLMEFLAGRGCHGILFLGTTGEGPSFSPEERLGILKTAILARATQNKTLSRVTKILAGTGTPSLTETISLTRSAFELGCDGVIVLPPYYYRKATDDGLFRYFCELIQRAVPSDGFLLGYHIPGTAGIGFSPDLLGRLKDGFPGQFAGIKDSSHDAEYARRVGERFGTDLLVLTGTDSLLQVALENHAQGCITAPANLISPALRWVWDAFQRGEDVSAMQGLITQIRLILEKYLPFPPMLKALLAKQYDLPRWTVRPPLDEASPESVEKAMKEILAVSI
jgi:4-hydroxy-tetrahydrodipicolinate synthase